MSYKVFFVEDEIITREGIRDTIDWHGNGFEFCGEATDGEMALPLLRTAQPDVLITDIKMPFMDGLQLSKIVRERMPWIKIIILSGHDEFEYAQKAIGLGITDYLLKPVTVQKLQTVLQKLTLKLDQEKKEQEHLKKLQEQMEDHRAVLRERLLLKLVVGAVSPVEAIEKGQLLGIDLIARHYLVVLLKLELGDRAEQYDPDEYQQVQNVITEIGGKNPDVLVLKRGAEEIIVVVDQPHPAEGDNVGIRLDGDARQQLIEGFASHREDGDFLAFDQAVEDVDHGHVGTDHFRRHDARHRIDGWPADVDLAVSRQVGTPIDRRAVATEYTAEDVP